MSAAIEDLTSPTPATVKRLFAQSRNKCARPECGRPLVEGPALLADLAHIEAASKDGPRYRETQSPAERRAEANFLVLCPTCHRLIDTDLKTYTTPVLQAMKAAHEGAGTPGEEPDDATASQLIRTVQVAILIETSFTSISIGQQGGYTANQITQNYYGQVVIGAAAEYDSGQNLAQSSIAVIPAKRWWCRSGDVLWESPRATAVLRGDTNSSWHLEMQNEDGAASAYARWDFVGWELTCAPGVTLTPQDRDALKACLSAVSPLRRGDMTELEVHLLDAVCQSIQPHAHSLRARV